MHNRYIILLFLFFILSCENKPNNDVLANVGSRKVTSFEFAESYSNKLIKTQLQDSEFERNRHFEFLIRNKLFSEAALRNQLQLDSLAQRYLFLDSIRFLRDELYYEEILNQEIEVDEDEIRTHYIWSKRECHFKHLFFNNKNDADSIYILLLSNPEKFDSIAFHTFSEEKFKQSGGDLGWLPYNALDPNLEKIGFDMALDEISLPVQSSFGWHILRKLNEKNQMITDDNSTLDEIKSSFQIDTGENVFSLKTNHRNTDEINDFIQCFYVGAETGMTEPADRHGDKPEIVFSNNSSNISFIDVEIFRDDLFI